jgi:hypothetical protein
MAIYKFQSSFLDPKHSPPKPRTQTKRKPFCPKGETNKKKNAGLLLLTPGKQQIPRSKTMNPIISPET